MSIFKEINNIQRTIDETQILDKAPALDLETLAQVKDDKSGVDKGEVDGIIKSAHDKENDEVETVTFGLETENDEIVKVYVNTKDADGFEEAMSKMLGQEDSIEDALEKMSHDFDIVDVEWPDDEEEEESKSDEDEESETDEEEINNDQTQKEGEEMTIGKSFLNKVLGEAKSTTGTEDAEFELFDVAGEGQEFIDSLRLATPYQKKILQVILLTGFPSPLLRMKRSTLRKNIVEVSRTMLKDANIRVWFQRFAKELAKAKGAEIKEKTKSKEEIAAEKEKEDAAVKEAVELKGTIKDEIKNPIQTKMVDLWSYLGIPDSLMKMRKAELKQVLRDLSVEIQKNSKVKIFLNMLVDAFGGGDKRNFDRKLEEAVNVRTSDKFSIAALNLMTALGLPEDHLNYKPSEVAKALKLKRSTLGNASQIMIKIDALINLIKDGTKKETATPPAESIKQEGRKIPRLTPAEAKSVIDFALGNGDMTDSAWGKVYEYFMERMPYGTMKGRDGDPQEWVGDYFAIDAKVKTADDVADELDSIWPENMTESLLSEMAKRGRPPKVKPLPGPKSKVQTNDAQDDLSLDDTDENAVDKDVETTKKVRMTKTLKLNPTDMGDWNVGDLGGQAGMLLKNRAFVIRLTDTEVEKLIDAIGDNKVIVVKGGTKKYSFRPYRMGSKNVYIVKQLDDTKYPDGVLVPASTVENILDHQFIKK